MDVYAERCAGIDIGKRDVKVCVRVPGQRQGRRDSQVRTFATTTAGLEQMAQWLVSGCVELVVMESTGGYWKPVFYACERVGLKAWLVNARHVKNVPGRKSDVSDAAWLAQLAEFGLVRPSFVPPPRIRRLRDLTRDRTKLTQDRTRFAQRVDNVLDDAGIKLSSVLSDIFGVSGRDMMAQLIAGQRDPKVLARLARRRAKNKIGQLEEALTGFFTDHHRDQLVRLLARYDFCTRQIVDLDTQIAAMIAAHDDLATAKQLLITSPGVAATVAEIIIAETGADMSQFPTAAHLSSWAGMCPGNNESAGRHKSTRTRHGNAWLRGALGQAASSAARTNNTFLAARYKRLIRRGKKRALVAVGRSILEAAWHILTTGRPYHELGPDHYTQRHGNRRRRAERLAHQIRVLGYTVALDDLQQTA